MTAKGFSDLNANEWHDVIGGAIFVIGCLMVFAYIAYDLWKEHHDPLR
jgi:hypothetical protein